MTPYNKSSPNRDDLPETKKGKAQPSNRLDQWRYKALERREGFDNLTSVSDQDKATFQQRMRKAIDDRFEHTQRENARAMRSGISLAVLIIFIPVITVLPVARWMGIPNTPLDLPTSNLLALNASALFGSLAINLLGLWLNNLSFSRNKFGSGLRFGSWLVITICFVLGYMLFNLQSTRQALVPDLSPFDAFVRLYLVLLSTTLMWLIIFYDTSISFVRLTRVRSRVPESIIITDLLDLLTIFEASKATFHQSATRLHLVKHISIVAESLRQELPRAYPVRQAELNRFVHQKAQEIGAGYESFSHDVIMAKSGGFEELRKQIANDLLNALEGNWDAFPRVPFNELLEQNQRSRLRRIVLNLASGLLPLGLLWIVQLFSFDLSAPAVDYIKLFAFFWLVVSLLSILDSEYSAKIGSVEKFFSTWTRQW